MRLSEETRLERIMDPALLGGLDENDPRSMAKVMKKMGALAGDDIGEDFEQMVDESVEEAMQEQESGGCMGESQGAGAGDDSSSVM